MKKILIPLFFVFLLNLFSLSSMAESNYSGKTVKSPEHRAVLFELYTSEGCSSCPPADHFLTKLKKQGINDEHIIPLAFHVTYWDYIGWKDRYAQKQFDFRQRDLAHKTKKNTVYTPQFVFSGKDFRLHARFDNTVSKFVEQKATVNLALTVDESLNKKTDKLRIHLASDISVAEVDNMDIYIAVVENNLSSDVRDGENEGRALQHDYVVRQLSVLYHQEKSQKHLEKEHVITLDPEWKRQDLSIVAFAENSVTGEILQAVKYNYQYNHQYDKKGK